MRIKLTRAARIPHEAGEIVEVSPDFAHILFSQGAAIIMTDGEKEEQASDNADTGDTSDNADAADTGDTSDNADAADTGDTPDTEATPTPTPKKTKKKE